MKKNTNLLAFLLLICTLSVMSCEQIEDGEHVDPVTLYEKVQGNWALTDVTQIDETAKIAGIDPNEMSLYNQFGFENFTLTLAVDDGNNPTSYKVAGDVPELFPTEGYWELSNSFPSASGSAPMIYLYADAGKTTQTGKLSVVSMPGAKAEMEVKLTRMAEGVPFVSYDFKLSNTNQ